MQFVLIPPTEPAADVMIHWQWRWKLVAATGPLAQSPQDYASEALARGAIAQFKRSASGVRFAKVVHA